MTEPTDLQLDWLQDHYRVGWRQRDAATIAAEFKRRFRKSVDAPTIQCWIDTLGCSPRRDSNRSRLTWAEDRYLRECVARHSMAKCAALLNWRFGAEYTATQIKNYIAGCNGKGRRKGVYTRPIYMGDNGRFRPGQRPPNKGELGDENVQHDSRGRPQIMVIVPNPDRSRRV